MNIDALSEDEQRQRIAELCGWIPHEKGTVVTESRIGFQVVCDQCNFTYGQFVDTDESECHNPEHRKTLFYKRWQKGDAVVSEFALPDYLHDLNAMAEAEKTLTMDGRERYDVRLAVIVGNDYHEHKTHWSARNTHATASQRARAFLAIQPDP